MLFSKKAAISDFSENYVLTSPVSRLEEKEIERCFTRLFATEDGRKVLAWLQVMTFHRAGNATTSDEQLRHMEGQRSLMAAILRMIDRGRHN